MTRRVAALVFCAAAALLLGGPGAAVAGASPSRDSTGPAVSLSATPSYGAAPLLVAFLATVSLGTPTGFNWSFGDGTYLNGTDLSLVHPSHLYTTPGSYTAGVRVWEGSTSGNGSIPIHVTAAPLALRVTATPTVGTAPLTVTFQGTVSGGTGTYVSFNWTFGDGATGTGATVQVPPTLTPGATTPSSRSSTVGPMKRGRGSGSTSRPRTRAPLPRSPGWGRWDGPSSGSRSDWSSRSSPSSSGLGSPRGGARPLCRSPSLRRPPPQSFSHRPRPCHRRPCRRTHRRPRLRRRRHRRPSGSRSALSFTSPGRARRDRTTLRPRGNPGGDQCGARGSAECADQRPAPPARRRPPRTGGTACPGPTSAPEDLPTHAQGGAPRARTPPPPSAGAGGVTTPPLGGSVDPPSPLGYRGRWRFKPGGTCSADVLVRAPCPGRHHRQRAGRLDRRVVCGPGRVEAARDLGGPGGRAALDHDGRRELPRIPRRDPGPGAHRPHAPAGRSFRDRVRGRQRDEGRFHLPTVPPHDRRPGHGGGGRGDRRDRRERPGGWGSPPRSG